MTRIERGRRARFQSTPSGGKATQLRVRTATPRVPFQSTPSGGKATPRVPKLLSFARFQSTPSGGKATLPDLCTVGVVVVSIHAFRGEGDKITAFVGRGRKCFNPRLPGGRRRRTSGDMHSLVTFQSTPSGGKATSSRCHGLNHRTGFNPRLPGGRRLYRSSAIRIHLLFQSTPSGGKATYNVDNPPPEDGVSIHAFRGEGDHSD